MDISIPYYEDLSRISNSNIGWFLQKGPAYLHKMLTDPPPEEKNPVLERGTMIHEYLLQPEEFQKDYVVWNKSRPSSAQQEKFCQALVSSVEIEPNKAILSAYKESYSTKGKSDDLMLSEGLKIASTLKDYIDFLKENNGRIMISPWDYQMLAKIQHNTIAHKLADNILYPKPTSDNLVTYHEFHINWECELEYKKSWISCKSLLDSLTLDFKNKKVTIADLKTTAKLWHFEESMEMYDYCRQLMYYCMAVQWYLKNELGEDPDEWKFEFYIIGIDTTGSCEIRVFNILEADVAIRKTTIYYALNEIKWHQSTGKWDHSRAYYEGDGSELLSL